jgi:2-hydroxychromene-2-carboxylate isomerase
MASAPARRTGQPAVASTQPIFYYDLSSPACYLVAEQIMSALPQAPEWEPVLGRRLPTGAGDPQPESTAPGPIERRAAELGLQALRWPPSLAVDSELAMLAATYCKRVGRAVAFSLAAFRQAFAGGRDLADPNTVLIAAAACEMHPAAVLRAVALRSVHQALRQATDRARSAGVSSLPAIQVGSLVFEGEREIDRAARALPRAR